MMPTPDQKKILRTWIKHSRITYDNALWYARKNDLTETLHTYDTLGLLKKQCVTATSPGFEWLKETPARIRAQAVHQLKDAAKGANTRWSKRLFDNKDKKHVRRPVMRTMKSRDPNGLIAIIAKESSWFKTCPETEKVTFGAFKTHGLGDVLLKDRERVLSWISTGNPRAHDLKIMMNTNTNMFYLIIPYKIGSGPFEERDSPNAQGSVALDPGVRCFQTCYSPNGTAGILLPDITSRLRPRYEKIAEYQSIADGKMKNPKFNARSKRRVKNKMKCLFQKCRNVRENSHYGAIKHLGDRYENIYLPIFKSSQMVEKERYYVNSVGKKTASKRKITRKTVREMLSLGHFEFRSRCVSRLGDKVKFVTEEYTTQTCSSCGTPNKKVGSSKQFKCVSKDCENDMHRDINGARCIFLKHHVLN